MSGWLGRIGLVAAFALLPSASAAAARETIPIKATLTGTFHPATDGVVCPLKENGVCGVKYRGDGTITGDLEGIVRFWGTEWVPLEGPTYSTEVLEFAGTVKGCGQGTFTYFANPVDDGGVDPAAGGYRGNETWHIEPGYSSSGLPGLSGSGTSPWLLRFDNTVIAEYTGTIFCDRADSPQKAAPPAVTGSKRKARAGCKCREARPKARCKRRSGKSRQQRSCRRGRG